MKYLLLKTVAMFVLRLIVVLPLAVSAVEATQVATPRFVTGLAPNQRPAGAPVILEFAPPTDWHTRSQTGVSEPIPVSLGFLRGQGAWYTPFNRPGMLGYYDLRNWHQGTRNATNGNQ